MDTVDILIRDTTDPRLQQAFAADPRAHTRLADNKKLNDQTWLQLWGENPTLPQALQLTARMLTPTQIEHVLRTERRDRVLLELVTHTELTDEQSTTLLALKPSTQVLTAWAQSGQIPAALTDTVTQLLPPEQRNQAALSSRHLFDQAQMLQLLHAPDSQQAAFEKATTLLRHPNAEPAVLTAAIKAYLESQAPGEPPRRLTGHLQRDGYRYAITRPWEEADTPNELALLRAYRRTLPPATAARVRAYEAAAWHARPEPADTSDPEISPGARLTDTTKWPAFTSPTTEAIEAALAAETPRTLHIAVTLMLDGYPGTIHELAATSRKLSETETDIPTSRTLRVAQGGSEPGHTPSTHR